MIDRLCLPGLSLIAMSLSVWLTSQVIYAEDSKSSTTGPRQPEMLIVSDNNYLDLTKPLDIYAPPTGAKRLISLPQLYTLIQSKGIALKVSRETFNAAVQSVKTENDRKIPVLSFESSHDQMWTKTKHDSDSSDDYSDRLSVRGSRVVNSSAGLSLSGTPLHGVTYKFQFPQLAHSQTMPETSASNPPRRDSAAFSSSLSVALLKDSPFFTESLSRRKSNLTIESAKEALRLDTLKKLAEAESNFYGLAQKFLQLSVQERSLKLAKALQAEVKEKISAGESSTLEATRAELQAAQAEVDFMSAQIDYEAAVAEFRNSLSLDATEGAGVFPDPKALNIDVEQFKVPANAENLIQTNNSEIKIAKLARESAQTELEIARKQTLPSLGLNASYGNVAPGDGWDRTTAEALKPNDRTFAVGLTFSQVLFNDTSKNAMQQAILSKQKADFSADETERRVIKEFNALVKKLDIGSRRYRIAKISREIAERKLNSEYEKFRAGESSVRNVIDSQTEVNGARISEISSRVEMLVGYGQLRTLLGKFPEGVTLTYGR